MNYDREFALFRVAIDIEDLFSELGTLAVIDKTRTVSTDIDAIKKLTDIALQSKNIELQEGLIGLREQLITIKESLLEAKEENNLLNQKLKRYQQQE